MTHDWTPTGRETVRQLQAKLIAAGLQTTTLADVPPRPRATIGDVGDPDAGSVPGITASRAVKGMIDGYRLIRLKGLTSLADKVARSPVILLRKEPNNMMSTTGRPGDPGSPQWLTVNLGALTDVLPQTPAPGEPWSVREARATLAGEAALQFVWDGAAVHEFGHVLDNMRGGRLEAALIAEIVDLVGRDRAQEWAAAHLSPYGASHPQEATAEAFSAAVYGKLPPELAAWGTGALAMAR